MTENKINRTHFCEIDQLRRDIDTVTSLSQNFIVIIFKMASKVAGGGGEEISEDGVKNDASEISIMVTTNIGPIKRTHYQRKKVECTICFKTMRSDTLKRHMKQHKDLYLLDEDEARQEIVLRKKIRREQETKQLNLERIANEEGASVECIEQDTKLHGLTPLPSIDNDEVHRRLLFAQREYDQKLMLGKRVYETLVKGVVKEESLAKQYRTAMEAYMVFSNKYPELANLSRDRWIIYNANKDGLNNVTENHFRMKRYGCKDSNNRPNLKLFGINKDLGANTLEESD